MPRVEAKHVSYCRRWCVFPSVVVLGVVVLGLEVTGIVHAIEGGREVLFKLGQRLIRKCDYHLGQQVHAMFRINAKSLPESTHRRHVTMFTTLDGGLGYVLPVTEKMYRRLLMLQNVMNNYCCHIAGLNPRAFRTYKNPRKTISGGPARGMLDGDLIALYPSMPSAERHDIAKKIGTKVEEIMADLYEIDRLTAHF